MIFDFSSRVLSRYIAFAKNDHKPITVYSNNAENTFQKYVLYNNIYTNQSASQINHSLQKRNFAYKNVRFVSCPNPLEKLNKSTLSIIDTTCGKLPTTHALLIAQLKDSGGTYHIVNDHTCKQYILKQYIAWLTVQDLHVEQLSEKNFCETFIIR